MRSLNIIGLGLSLTFGCLLVALMGEIYYLLWWKRRSWNRGITEDDCCSSSTSSNTSVARDFMYMFCCKKMSTLPLSNNSSSNTTVALTVGDRFHQQQNETQNSIHSNKDLLMLKSDGPPRLLFTIKEETREDLESEDGGTSIRSMSDLLVVQNSETPYLTPLSSPSMFTPPLTPLNSSYTTHIGFKFNPLFESSSDAELSRLKASPPPKFKFLQEAEDKFQRKRMMEEAREHVGFKDHLTDIECAENPENRVMEDESFITIIVAKGRRGGQLV